MMGYVNINSTKLALAYRYANLQRDNIKRDYVMAYIGWLRNGGEGLEPERGRAQWRAEVRAVLDGMGLWEGIAP